MNLPSGWVQTSLGEILTPRADRVDPLTCRDARYIGLEHVEPHTSKITATVDAGQMSSSAARFTAGDVLYGRMRPYLNKVVRPSFSGLASAEFIVLPPNDAIDGDFLLRRLSAADFVEFACGQYEGDRPRVKFEQLARFAIALPPRAEQCRIAIALASLLGELDIASAELDFARRKLALYRQSLLKSAVEGTLTADARRSRSTAPDLESIPAGWTRVSIARLTSLVTSGSRGWAEHYAEDGAVFIRSQDIKRDTLNLSACARVRPPKGGEGTRTRVRKDDILLTITGANVGKCALVTVSLEEAYVSQHVALIRLREPTLARHVHMYMVAEAGGRGRLDKLAYGAGKPGLNLEQVRTLDVPLPPSWEIELISQRIDSLMEALNRLQSEIDQQLHLASNQRQNILRAAFSGQLVPQDPNDEPASVLLERIRAKRPALAAAPRARRPRAAKERA